MIVGYARVSTRDQDLTIQQQALAGANCEKVFSEKQSGTGVSKRDQLSAALEFVREGDVLVVTRMDRIARSSHDLHNIVRQLSDKGVGFRCVEQSAVDTTTAQGKLMLAMLAAVAEFETDIRKDRQMEGIAKAKAAGVYKGRKATIKPEEVKALQASGMKPTDIARDLGINRASVYRALA